MEFKTIQMDVKFLYIWLKKMESRLFILPRNWDKIPDLKDLQGVNINVAILCWSRRTLVS